MDTETGVPVSREGPSADGSLVVKLDCVASIKESLQAGSFPRPLGRKGPSPPGPLSLWERGRTNINLGDTPKPPAGRPLHPFLLIDAARSGHRARLGRRRRWVPSYRRGSWGR